MSLCVSYVELFISSNCVKAVSKILHISIVKYWERLFRPFFKYTIIICTLKISI